MSKLYGALRVEGKQDRYLGASEEIETWAQTKRGRITVRVKGDGAFTIFLSEVNALKVGIGLEIAHGNVDALNWVAATREV